MVHSSLSGCGQYVAGPGDVIDSLQGVSDTLIMPTHTYCYPLSFDVEAPLFDARETSSKVGVLTEIFWRTRGAKRSTHATHSLAMLGKDVGTLPAGHYLCDLPCGAETPYARLIEQDAAVLMLGVSFDSYTFFHTAECAAESPFAVEEGVIDRLRVVDERGATRVCMSRRQGRSPMRFAEVGDLLERVGLVHREPLGMGNLFFVQHSAKVHDFLLRRLRRWPDFLRASCKIELE